MRLNKYILILIAGLAAAGCLRDADFVAPGGDYNGADEIELVMSVDVPSDNGGGATRALEEKDESWITDITVIVFDSNSKFAYSTYGYDIDNTSTSPKTFKMMVKMSSSGASRGDYISKSMRFLFLANSRAEWDGVKNSVTTDYSVAQVLGLLRFDTSEEWDADGVRYLPMSAATPSKTISATMTGSTFGTIAFTRSVTAIDIGFGYGAGIVPNGLANFRLSQVVVRNSTDAGFLTPYTTSLNNTSLPNVPSNAGSVAELSFELPSPSPQGMFRQIYLSEKNGAMNTSDKYFYLLIGGYYTPDGGSENSRITWYKLELPGTNKSYSQPFYRNYRYTVKVEEITGPGYDNKEDAANGGGNAWINATVIPWNMSNVSQGVDGPYGFDISQREFTLNHKESTDGVQGYNILEPYTDYSGGWKVDEITYEGAPSLYWLSTDITGGDPFVAGSLSILVTKNESDEDRVGYIHLSAGRWKYKVKVTQKAFSNDSGGGNPPILGPDGSLYVLAVDRDGVLNLDGDGKIVLFKWGSAIAIASPTKGDTFDSSDIAWVPPGYDYQQLVRNVNNAVGTAARWEAVPYVTSGNTYPENTSLNLVKGLGDPCRFASKNGVVGGYRMPRMIINPHYGTGEGWEPTVQYMWFETIGPDLQNPDGRYNDDNSVFYPACQGRTTSTNSEGTVNNFNRYGCYWSVTNTTGHPHYMRFSSDALYLHGTAIRASAMGVRCVPEDNLVVRPMTRTISFWAHRNGAMSHNTFAVDTDNEWGIGLVSYKGQEGDWGLTAHKTADGRGFYVQCDLNGTGLPRSATVSVYVDSALGRRSVDVEVTQDYTDCGLGGTAKNVAFDNGTVRAHVFGGNPRESELRVQEAYYGRKYDQMSATEKASVDRLLAGYPEGEHFACWMIENSTYGTPNTQKYNNSSTQIGPYYSKANAAGACPEGWKLPGFNELFGMTYIYKALNVGFTSTEELVAWNLFKSSSNTFAGCYLVSSGFTNWTGWGNNTYFYSDWDGKKPNGESLTANTALYIATDGLLVASGIDGNTLAPVRCVKESTYHYE